ncbi:hypothetical protein EJ377_08010 [Chryseobacterium arthrosphaerae]|uniref:Tail specific protease domain-containing protein n=1 Tax=Chryseobacterium arthrosphaerae TaxID=651561 RepID=A0A3S0QIP2_9FLAO|nr:hypothetical protein EJ377_08010 [Chryseobacterium arthrosphaerae]
MNIKISRNGKTESLTVKTFEPKELNIKKEQKDFFKMLDNQTGYFTWEAQMGKAFRELQPTQNTKGIVIDLRSYPSDFVVFSMGKLLKKILQIL